MLFGQRRCKNLCDHLVRADLKPKVMGLKTRQVKGKKGKKQKQRQFISTICRTKKCRICPILDKSGKIRSYYSKEKFRTRTKISCKSNNLIYALECTKCKKQYVGETKRTIRERMTGHIHTIKSKQNHKPVPQHYNSAGHCGFDDIRIFILKFCQTPPDDAHRRYREIAERKWQDRLHSSYPWGLNREDAIPDKGK